MNDISELQHFLSAAESLWEQYLELGPGKLSSEDHETVNAHFESCQSLELPEPITKQLCLTHELTRRCAVRPEGLCFITGEAGLIPRKDQHQSLQSAMVAIRDFLQTIQARRASE